MHSRRRTISIMAAAALAAGNATATSDTHATEVPVTPAESAAEFVIHTCYSSGYLWRGLDLGNDLSEAGLDVSTTWNGIGLSAGAWFGNFTYAGRSQDELDLYGEISKDLGPVKGSIGYTAYTYPGSSSQTAQEIYFGLSHDFSFATASLKYYWGIVGDNDGYSEFGLTRSFTLSPCLALNLETNIGYLVEHGVATAWTNKVSLDWGFAEHAKLSPYVALSIALTDDKFTSYFNSDNELVAGCKVSVTF